MQPCAKQFPHYQSLIPRMKHVRKPVILLLLSAVAALLSGCFSPRQEQDSSIPWSRPAGWEGQVPGMGNPEGSGVR
jgi:hypothetical protein